MTSAQKSDFVSRARNASRNLLKAREEVAALIEVNTQTGMAASLTDGDFIGDNAGILATEFSAAATVLATVNSGMLAGGAASSQLSKLLKIS